MNYEKLFGRRPDTPRDSRDYPLSKAVRGLMRTGQMSSMAAAPPRRTYRAGPVLDQSLTPESFDGDHPYCAGFATAALRMGDPVRVKLKPNPVAYALAAYAGAQQLDEWEGPPPPYDGTSGRGACQWLRSTGQAAEFHAIADADEAADTVLRYRGFLLGIPWYASMMEPAPGTGLLTVDPSSGEVGGHEVWARGYDSHKEWFLIRNSWSEAWGVKGDCHIKKTDLQGLLDAGGDAFVPSEIRVLG